MRRGVFWYLGAICYSRFPHTAWRQEYSAESRASVEGRSFPMMEPPTSAGNRLLAAMPPADFGLLDPYLQKVSLEQDAVLVRSGDRIEQVHFPHSGAISFMLDMPNGQTVATAVIGHEGAVGMLSVLEPSRSPVTAGAHTDGGPSPTSTLPFHSALTPIDGLRPHLQTHTRALLTQ